MSKKYQTVILTTSDGKKHSFVGEATIIDETLTVIQIEVTPPKNLPKDMYFETVEENIE